MAEYISVLFFPKEKLKDKRQEFQVTLQHLVVKLWMEIAIIGTVCLLSYFKKPVWKCNQEERIFSLFLKSNNILVDEQWFNITKTNINWKEP